MAFWRNKAKPKNEYKGIPIGVLRGIRSGFILAYYCTNCYYGIHDEGLKKEMKKCPKCNALLDWNNINL